MNITDRVINVLYDFFVNLVSKFPVIETVPVEFGSFFRYMQIANYFIPVPTFVAAAALLFSVATGIGIYKLVKLVRGGG